MSIYRLTYPTSLELIRLSRSPLTNLYLRDQQPNAPWPSDKDRPGITDLMLAKETDPWYPGPSHSIRALVASKADRRRSPCYPSRVCEGNLPRESFRLVERRGLGRVLVESPQLVVVRAAADLERRIAEGTLDATAACLRLVLLMDELCGRFSRTPFSWWEDGAASDVRPVMSVAQLRSYLAEASGIRGLPLARRASRLALDNLGSYMEAVLELLLCARPRYGGLGLPLPVSNEELDFDQRRERVLHDVMRPDLRWPSWALAIEYNGTTHDDPRSAAEDDRRMLDYQACDIRALPVRYANVVNEPQLDKLLTTVVEIGSGAEGREWRRYYLARLKDDGYRRARQALLATLVFRSDR